MKKTIVLNFLSLLFWSAEAQEISRQIPSLVQIADVEMKAKTTFQKSFRTANSLASVNFNVHYYRCEWELDPAVRFISGIITSCFSIITSTNTIIYDLHSALTVDSIIFKNHPVSFQQTPANNVIIQLSQRLLQTR